MKLKTLLKKLGTFEDIEALASNQYKVYLTNGVLFQSYNTIMCIKYKNRVYLRKNWQISNTTSKYLYIFLNINNGRKELLNKIENKQIEFWE